MQIAFIITGVLIFLSFFVAVFDRVLNLGNIAGMLLGGIYIAVGVLITKLDSVNQILVGIAGLCFLMYIALTLREIYVAGKTDFASQEVVIVLGCRVRGDEPSTALVKRTNAAYAFLLNNPNAVAILSGGQGKDESLSEAACMQKLLYDRGILKDRLILEDKSTSTEENIRFSTEIMSALGMKKEAAIATSEYHQKRAAQICKKYGLKTIPVSSKTKWTLLPTFLFREMLAEVKFKLNN